MHIISQESDGIKVVDTKELSFPQMKHLSNDIVFKILSALNREPTYPKLLAKKLKLYEQTVYYYIKKLERAGIITSVKQEQIHGTMAKFYAPTAGSFFTKIQEMKLGSKIAPKTSAFLDPFISNGMLNAYIIVGSPDPHGPNKARARDGHFAIDIALFLGSFIHSLKQTHVRVDTEVTDSDLRNNNLIIIGGPIVNSIAHRLGTTLPAYYDIERKGFYSVASRKLYEKEDIGIIVKHMSPFNPEKQVLHIAGTRTQGTKAALLAFTQHFSDVEQGNKFKPKLTCKIIEGIDSDSDGMIDAIEFIE